MCKQHIPHHILAQVTASHCCICRAKLTDAESVENGMGPICSKNYYSIQHEPSECQVLDTLGLIACSNLTPHIVDAFLKLVNNDRVNARKGCNLLVYWASCNYADRDEVFKCSALIRTLGYTALAEKLETDRTEGIVLDKNDHLEVFLPSKQPLDRDLKRIPGAMPFIKKDLELNGHVTETRIKKGHKVGWVIPKTEEEHFECVLSVHMGGKLFCGTKGLRTITRRQWAALLKYRKPTPTTQQETTQQLNLRLRRVILAEDPIFITEGMGDKLRVITPYNGDFIFKLKLKVPYKYRAWDSFNKWWEVSREYQQTILQLVQECYGVPVGATP